MTEWDDIEIEWLEEQAVECEQVAESTDKATVRQFFEGKATAFREVLFRRKLKTLV